MFPAVPLDPALGRELSLALDDLAYSNAEISGGAR